MVSKPLAHRQPSFGLAKPNHHLFQHCQPSIGTFTTSHHLNIANSHFSNIRVVRDFTIHSNTNGLGLRSNAIKDLCPLILHQLVIGWIGKAHGSTPSHFILSLLDVYRDTTTRDKLIFPSDIIRIICHSSVFYLEFVHFIVMGAISAVSV